MLEGLFTRFMNDDCENSPHVFVEFFDEGKWNLSYMPVEHAFLAQLVMGDKFHYLDDSMIKFEE